MDSTSQAALAVKNLPASAGAMRLGLIPGSGGSPGGGRGPPLRCSCLENPMDRGAWWATIQGHKELDTTEVTWSINVYSFPDSFPLLFIIKC